MQRLTRERHAQNVRVSKRHKACRYYRQRIPALPSNNHTPAVRCQIRVTKRATVVVFAEVYKHKLK
jgi:hypothetical protein